MLRDRESEAGHVKPDWNRKCLVAFMRRHFNFLHGVCTKFKKCRCGLSGQTEIQRNLSTSPQPKAIFFSCFTFYTECLYQQMQKSIAGNGRLSEHDLNPVGKARWFSPRVERCLVSLPWLVESSDRKSNDSNICLGQGQSLSQRARCRHWHSQSSAHRMNDSRCFHTPSSLPTSYQHLLQSLFTAAFHYHYFAVIFRFTTSGCSTPWLRKSNLLQKRRRHCW